jgi:hypothetical protein
LKELFINMAKSLKELAQRHFKAQTVKNLAQADSACQNASLAKTIRGGLKSIRRPSDGPLSGLAPIDHSLTAGRQEVVVLSERAALGQLGKGSLDYPALWQHHKALPVIAA